MSEVEANRASPHSLVRYDLFGKLAEDIKLSRRTIADILTDANVAVFAQFKTNPVSFINLATRLVNEQKAIVIVEHLAYGPVEETYDMESALPAKAVRTSRMRVESYNITFTTTWLPIPGWPHS